MFAYRPLSRRANSASCLRVDPAAGTGSSMELTALKRDLEAYLDYYKRQGSRPVAVPEVPVLAAR